MEQLRPADRVGLVIIGLIGLTPILLTLLLAWWVMLGGRP